MSLPQLVGMIHLPALPGSPAWDGTPLPEIADAALADASALEGAGFDAVLVQNSLDRPTRERVDQLAVAQLTAVTQLVRMNCALSVGVNVVKNDGPAAMAIASAAGAAFVRVKVLAGTRMSAEGLIHGCAHETASMRQSSGARPAIWADVREPTSLPMPGSDFASELIDSLDFGAADALIVTGSDTTATFGLAEQARKIAPAAELVIGGRVNASSVSEALERADSVIIGSALKDRPGIRGRVDLGAAEAIARAAGRAPSEKAHQ